MVLALQCFIAECRIERFRVHRGVQLKVREAAVPCDAFHLPYEGRADTPASSFGHHVARSQFCVVNDERAEPYSLPSSSANKRISWSGFTRKCWIPCR